MNSIHAQSTKAGYTASEDYIPEKKQHRYHAESRCISN